MHPLQLIAKYLQQQGINHNATPNAFIQDKGLTYDFQDGRFLDIYYYEETGQYRTIFYPGDGNYAQEDQHDQLHDLSNPNSFQNIYNFIKTCQQDQTPITKPLHPLKDYPEKLPPKQINLTTKHHITLKTAEILFNFDPS